MASSVKQGIISKKYAKNSKAKYKLTYKSVYKQTLQNNILSYKSSKSIKLSYKVQ